MSRYLERAEHTARVLGVHLNLALEQPLESSEGRWTQVRKALGIETSKDDPEDSGLALHELCFDVGHRSSIVNAIRSARDNARQVREQISSEMWEQLNRLYHEVHRAEHSEFWESEPIDFLNAVKEGSHLFQGLTDSTMTHDEGWYFIQLGLYLERTLNVTNLVDVHFARYGDQQDQPASENAADTGDYLEWVGLLKCATAFEAYCKEYTAVMEPQKIGEFLLFNASFPHSVRFSASRMESVLNSISMVSPSRRGGKVQRIAGKLSATLNFTQIEEILSYGMHDYLVDLRRQCGHIHSGTFQAFITYPIEAALVEA